MKFIRLFPITVFALSLFVSCLNPDTYNDTIISPQRNMVDDLVVIIGAATPEKQRSELKNKVIAECETALKNIGELKSSSFRDVGIEYYAYIKDWFSAPEFDETFKKIKEQNLSKEETIAFMKKISELEEIENRLRAEQQKFAADNNLILEQ